MKKFKLFTDETVIAIFWKEAYYGTRRGDIHRGCCNLIPIGEGIVCFSNQYQILTKRCCICDSELTTKEERATLTVVSF